MKTITLEDGTKVKISEESYRNLQESVKPEFKKGVWYKHINDSDGGGLVNYQEGGSGYGFWDNEWDNTWSISSREHWIEATKEEIEEALTKEFHRRYKKGDYVRQNIIPPIRISGRVEEYEMDSDKLWVHFDDIRFCGVSGGVIYEKGKWAEKVEEKDYNIIELPDENKAEILYTGNVSFNDGKIVLPFKDIKNIYKAAKRRKCETGGVVKF